MAWSKSLTNLCSSFTKTEVFVRVLNSSREPMARVTLNMIFVFVLQMSWFFVSSLIGFLSNMTSTRVFEMIKFRQLWLHVNGKVTPLNLWVLNLNMAIKRVGFVWKIISRLVWFQNLIRKMSKRQRSTYHWGYNEWSGYKYSCYFISLLSHLNRCQQNSTTFHYHMFWEVMYCHPSIL